MNRTRELSFIRNMNVQVTRKRMKSIRMRVTSNGSTLKISAPYWTQTDEIMRFIAANEKWIIEQQENNIRREKNRLDGFQAGALTPIWGVDHRLVFEDAKNQVGLTYQIERSDLKVYTKLEEDLLLHEKIVAEIYKDLVRKRAWLMIEKWSAYFNIEVRTLSVKKMKTRWGSCNPTLKKINLNSELARFQEDCLEYVVVHEMAHFFELNHSPKFWAIVTKAMPNWKRYHRILN